MLQYPTSSGYKTGYIRRSEVFNVSAPSECVTSKAKVNTYKPSAGSDYGYITGSDKPSGNSYYGYIAVNDRVYACGTFDSKVAVIYQAKSGSRAYKLGYISINDYANNVKKSSQQSSRFQYPMSGYCTTQGFGAYSSKMAKKGRAYHSGIDIKSDNTRVNAAADGTIKYRGYTSGNGNHVIIQHNLNGTTVYTLYSHLANFNGCPSVGNRVSKGAQIGIMGNTGNSSGPHLHFGVFTGYSSDPYGYTNVNSSYKASYNRCTFYNPNYVISNNMLP